MNKLTSQYISSISAIAVLLFSLFVSASSYATGNLSKFPIYKYPSQEKIDRQVDSVFSILSTREKIAQLMIIGFTSKDSQEEKMVQEMLVQKEKVGGLINLADDVVAAMERMNQLNGLAQIPLITSIDAEWGVGMRYKEIPGFQYFLQLGALGSDSLVYEMGKYIGMECRALKFILNYSPVLDLNNNPVNHILNYRSFGGDQKKVAKLSIAMMRGMRDGGIAGAAKHFPGHGDTNVDSHIGLPVLPFTAQRLDTLETYPYKQLIADGVDMVMVGHLSIPALDSSGTPSSISKPIVTGLLKEKMGFEGIVCTDALGMHGLSKWNGMEKKDIPLTVYKAGVDMFLMPEDVENAITVIEQALENGEITMEGLDKRVKKMLALKARLGIFDKDYDPYVDLKTIELLKDTQSRNGYAAHKQNLINEIAKESMTVLFNDNSLGNGLPVSLEGKKVAYVGYRNPQLGCEFGVLANKYGQIDTVIIGNDSSFVALKEAKNKLKNYDLVIMGFNDTQQDPHLNFGINEDEVNFITDWAAEQPMIAVYLGSPYALDNMPGHKNFTALVLGYHNTSENNSAAAQVVFGAIPAKGVMPVTTFTYKVGESVLLPDK